MDTLDLGSWAEDKRWNGWVGELNGPALICLFLLLFFPFPFHSVSFASFLWSLLPFSIPGFPLDKAVAYSKLRNPFLINDLAMQYYIQDRYSFLLTGGWVGGPEITSV